jgi:hypothetical protein
MLNLERIPDQVGYLLLTEDGAVISFGGEMENEKCYLWSELTHLCKRISVVYDDH